MHKTRKFTVGNDVEVYDHGNMSFSMFDETFTIDTGSNNGEAVYTVVQNSDYRPIFYGFEDGEWFVFISAGDSRYGKDIIKTAARMLALIY